MTKIDPSPSSLLSSLIYGSRGAGFMPPRSHNNVGHSLPLEMAISWPPLPCSCHPTTSPTWTSFCSQVTGTSSKSTSAFSPSGTSALAPRRGCSLRRINKSGRQYAFRVQQAALKGDVRGANQSAGADEGERADTVRMMFSEGGREGAGERAPEQVEGGRAD